MNQKNTKQYYECDLPLPLIHKAPGSSCNLTEYN